MSLLPIRLQRQLSELMIKLPIYGIRSPHIFEISSISNEKPSISIETLSISIKNLGFRSKYYVF